LKKKSSWRAVAWFARAVAVIVGTGVDTLWALRQAAPGAWDDRQYRAPLIHGNTRVRQARSGPPLSFGGPIRENTWPYCAVFA
jgi:hypothetical protein